MDAKMPWLGQHKAKNEAREKEEKEIWGVEMIDTPSTITEMLMKG
jgi:hypothetical protein